MPAKAATSRKRPARGGSPTRARRRSGPQDYTGAILSFLESAHGRTRVDERGDYFYENVSAISLHFLLNAELPGREVLWQWYQHYDQHRAESIYQTIAPLDDETLLAILERCEFQWDPVAVRGSGLVFLAEHRRLVYLMLTEFLEQRLEAYRTMSDERLAETLRPQDTWSDRHLARLIQQIQTQPLTPEQRGVLYEQLDTGYLRATARHLLDQATKDAFWKSPPPELEELEAGMIAFVRHMTAESRRLGVFVSKAEFDQQWSRQAWDDFAGGPRARTRRRFQRRQSLRESHFATLGLEVGASLGDVKSAYREMVKRHHPDQGGTVQDFLQLQEAYEYLLTEVF